MIEELKAKSGIKAKSEENIIMRTGPFLTGHQKEPWKKTEFVGLNVE